jgi:hypothetical protein
MVVVVIVLGERARAAHQAEHKRRRRDPFHGSHSSKAHAGERMSLAVATVAAML